MYTAFDSQYAHIPGPAYSPQRKRFPSFLSSVKDLIKRPSRTHLEVPTTNNQDLRYRSPSREHERSRSPVPRLRIHSWGRSSRKGQRPREHIPSMIDYLTLSQLENVWYKQDSYRGCVAAPQTAPIPEVERWQQQESRQTTDSIGLTAPLRRHSALRGRRRSFENSVWSRPPSYRA